MSLPRPGESGPDHSVRPAREADLAAIGAVHARSWTGPYASVLPEAVVQALTGQLLAEAWRPAVTSPPSTAHRVHVALGDGMVVGFAASAPLAGRSDAVELVALEVDPAHTRQGHGSRLLAAVADTAREHGAELVVAWVHVDDEPRSQFLRSAGLDADGARRRRGIDGADPGDHRSVWPEVRLLARLDPDQA